jgi:hypothetical protein
MIELDEHGRPEPPLAGDEIATIVGFLEYQRATMAWKCWGLDMAGVRATVGASPSALGIRSGRTPWPAPVPGSRRRLLMAAW